MIAEKNPYKFSNKLLAVIFILSRDFDVDVMVLGAIISCSCFNIKRSGIHLYGYMASL